MSNLTIDIDCQFERFDIEEYRQFMKDTLRVQPDKVWIRESPNNHVHLMLSFLGELSLMQQLQLRAVLRDDAYRIRCDLVKLYLFDAEAMVMQLFDCKYDGREKQAGTWREITHKEG